LNTALPFVVFAFFAGVIWLQRHRGTARPQGRFRDLPRNARLAVLPAWALGMVAIVGASAEEALAVLLIPAGVLLVVTGAALREYRPPGRVVNMRFVVALTVLIGVGWAAVGVVTLVALLA
jgi:hypothetical protein